MIYVSVDEVILLQEKLINRYGGLEGIRDFGLLESSIKSIYQTFDGKELYPTILSKIVTVSYLLIKNHCFYDGNKRIAMMLLLYLLKVNNINHTLTNKEIINLGLSLASGSMSKDEYMRYIIDKVEVLD